ncbi:MAG: hypothetical protein EA369_00160 [Bradymonadales bacterium]|nr:MAG: hypothetical protein EA369_00160 [Bradymonadales bacterium]
MRIDGKFGFWFLLLFGLTLTAMSLIKNQEETESEDEVVFCTMDVKECPDGSFVSRDPSKNCEFFPCPEARDR